MKIKMGARGPVGKRSTERMGHRTKEEQARDDRVTIPGPLVEQPAPDEAWHEVARRWYVSLAESGQSMFYEPSDWAAAQYVATVMSRNLEAGKFNGQLFASIWTAMGDLMTTEGSRRRMRLELERTKAANEAGDTAASILDEYRAKFAVA